MKWTLVISTILVAALALVFALGQGNGRPSVLMLNDNSEKDPNPAGSSIQISPKSCDCTNMEICISEEECRPACSSDRDCDSEWPVCGAGICTNECELESVDDGCEGDEMCAYGMCQKKCDSSSTCPGDQVCVNGICWTCSENSDCGSDDKEMICSDGVCTTGCSDDGDCSPDTVCCKSKSICKYSCQIDYDCPGPLDCDKGICGPACQVDGDCPSGRICNDEVCHEDC